MEPTACVIGSRRPYQSRDTNELLELTEEFTHSHTHTCSSESMQAGSKKSAREATATTLTFTRAESKKIYVWNQNPSRSSAVICYLSASTGSPLTLVPVAYLKAVIESVWHDSTSSVHSLFAWLDFMIQTKHKAPSCALAHLLSPLQGHSTHWLALSRSKNTCSHSLRSTVNSSRGL